MNTKNSGFLPDGYKEVSGYMKFEDGANRFRILSSAIVGYEYWNEDKDGNRKPIRKHLDEDLIMSEIQEPDKVKKFWAFIVWNYKDEAIQILEITQNSIKKALQALINNKKWGSPVDSYDIVITREGTGLGTKYTVQPDPKEATAKTITEAKKAKFVDLEALFRGEDPFLSTKKEEPEEVNIDDIDIP